VRAARSRPGRRARRSSSNLAPASVRPISSSGVPAPSTGGMIGLSLGGLYARIRIRWYALALARIAAYKSTAGLSWLTETTTANL